MIRIKFQRIICIIISFFLLINGIVFHEFYEVNALENTDSLIKLLSNTIWTGTYDGYYDNNIPTKRRLKIELTSIDKTGNISGIALFSPYYNAPHTANGEYEFTGNIDYDTMEICFQGVEWIEKPNDKYTWNFPKFTGIIYNNKSYEIKGTLNSNLSNNSFELNATYCSDNNKKLSAIDFFEYNSHSYNYDLALECAEYCMLAYDDCSYEDSIYFNTGKRNNAPYYLWDKLYENHWQGISCSNYCDDNPHNVSYTIATKKVIAQGNEENLVIVVIRGTNTDEWYGNMDITGEKYDKSLKEHYSFELAANDLENNIFQYLQFHNIENTKLIITGHSRGAAVANIVAKDMTDMSLPYGQITDVYAYTFATPNCTLEYESVCDSYDNIYNFCFNDDFVPSVPLNDWGYKKYGHTLTSVAQDCYSNTEFQNSINKYVTLSGDKDGIPCFKAEDTYSLLSYMYNVCPNTNSYYSDLFYVTTSPNDSQQWTLYNFFRNKIAPAAMMNSKTNLKTINAGLSLFINHKTYMNPFCTIGTFFIEGATDGNINDTHQMFTYYTALKNQLFSENYPIQLSYSTKTSYSINNIALSSNFDETLPNITESDCCDIDLNNLKNIFIKNKEILNWNDENLYNWYGITWSIEDGIYYVSNVDISNLNLNGDLNLSNMPYLNTLSCNNNNLSSLNISNCNNLTYVSCISSGIEYLNLENSNNINVLLCNENYLDITNLENQLNNLFTKEDSMILYKTQYVKTEDKSLFSSNDYENLINFYNYHGNNLYLNWDINTPGNWTGITWKKIDDIYYVTDINFNNIEVSGNLDLSSYKYLETYSGANTKISEISLPISTQNIYYTSFYNCNNLQKITIYNKNIIIDFESFYYLNPNLTIYSYEDSSAKYYADKNNIRFVSLEKIECYENSIKYDIDTNGIISYLDIILYKKYLLGISSLENQSFANADVNNDYEINILDFIMLKHKILSV